uniref:Pentacotripeptide-repeat region of PRORP domain-containing protein n=1 Tax=Leersia perrieri TaxID=77586 RepID=A0A0D9WX78_9ORYZ
MERCSIARPFGATAAAPPPRLSPRRRRLATSPATARGVRLPALQKPPKPPPPPLHPRPNLPIPTTTTTSGDGPATDATAPKRGDSQKPATDSPCSSGAGDVLRLLDALRLPADEVYVCLLRDCADAAEVASVHAHIAGSFAISGLPLPLANRLVLAYAVCSDIGAARQVFDEMPVKNGITWATMVSAYSDGCFHHDALQLFAQMCHQVRGLTGDHYTHAVVAVLRSCVRLNELRFGEQVHAFVVKKNGVCGDVGSSLLQLYCDCGPHSSALHVLEMMRCSSCQEPVPEAAWTSLITAYHRDGILDDAIDIFRDMVSSSSVRSSFSLSSILAVCAEAKNKGRHGQQLHADAIKRGLDMNQFVGSGLLHMYAKQGQLADAARAFEAIGGKPDAVCWNAMAMAYARGGRYRDATRVVYQMKAAGMNPSELTMNEVKLACFR